MSAEQVHAATAVLGNATNLIYDLLTWIVFLAPAILVIALIVWLIRRNRKNGQ